MLTFSKYFIVGAGMTNRKKQISKMVPAAIFIAWIIFNGILLVRHELWRDEANVWLMAKNLNPLQLFAEIKYQGHPCLWYLLVMPFAKAGLPFQTISVLSFLIMAVSAGLFLWKAPTRMLTKAICLFSPIFTYYYSVVARNYCLIALLFMLLAWYYPKRNDKPLIYGLLLGLLVQTDTIALAGAGLISCMWLWEGITGKKKKHSPILQKIMQGVWIPFASVILWVAQFLQISDSPQFQFRSMGIQELFQEVRNYCYHIFMRLSGQEKTFCTIAFLSFLIIGVMISLKLKDFWPFLVMIGSFGFQAVFSVLVYQLHIWHFISLCFVYLWLLWIWQQQKIRKKLTDRLTEGLLLFAEIWLIVLAILMFVQWNSEEESSCLNNALHGVYSDGINAADFIDHNIGKEQVLVSTNVAMASTVLAYLDDYECYFAGSGEKVSYADYSNQQEQTITLDNMMSWAAASFPDKQEIYLIKTKDSCLDDADYLEQCICLYQTQVDTARGEAYSIYQIPIR